ncbi:hypothetical protein TNCV_3324041 [Trichonephila clavipes]|nr:hypothetical protein TNCV_3324041 [Trichonephila clavipes]
MISGFSSRNCKERPERLLNITKIIADNAQLTKVDDHRLSQERDVASIMADALDPDPVGPCLETSLLQITAEPPYNEPLYCEFFDIANFFLEPGTFHDFIREITSL